MGLVSAIIGVLNCAVVALAWPSPPSRYPEISVWDIAIPVVGVLGCPMGLTFGLIAVRDRERASRVGVVLNILPYVAIVAATLAR